MLEPLLAQPRLRPHPDPRHRTSRGPRLPRRRRQGAGGGRPREDDYRAALLEKLFEEAAELREAADSEVAEEIADVLEVLRAIAKAHGHEWADIEKVGEAKRAERGAFLGRIHLEG